MTHSIADAPPSEDVTDRLIPGEDTEIVEARRQISATHYTASSISLVVLAVLGVLAALYLAADILIPFTLAVVFNLLLQPPKRFLCDRLRFPSSLASLVLIVALFSVVGAIGAAISVPASDWVARAPESLPTLQEKLRFLQKPIAYVEQGMQQIDQLMNHHQQPEASGGGQQTVSVQQSSGIGGIGLSVLSGTRDALGKVFTLVVMLFFMLASGDSLLRRLVEIMPTWGEKRRVVEISDEIERNVSGYLATITMMNILVGVANGISTWLFGLPDPLLWGTVAFLLNYIPIVGPVCGMGLFFLVGLFVFPAPLHALLPAAVYLGIHVIEGETVTPMLLASRFTLNPVLVILSLFFWDWMWGVIGALLAVPLLAVAKIVADRVPALTPIGHLLGGTRK